ncbi:peptidoglycan bridge formation glycyltransferase FemA/FemB family protein, partial [Candidatus Gottesmanbacteria bacterium]|nr:peptidoglycan bridge formation glycyltransferase FemA/FemB family protein [Candidatus Gottesmanbacteria bacterium]
HPLFTKYTFQLSLTKSEEELLKNMHSKTRYNIKVAQKHEVIIKEDNSNQAFEKYLQLTFATTRRQKFYAHNRRYHQLMWETLKSSKIAHLLTANYQYQGKNHTLVTWIVFLFNNILYYPYGASSSEFRNVMASNLMMWEAIRWGKKNGAKLFDMWGSLGPAPDISDPWYGFHRFKQGYGTKLVEFVGSFDLVINPFLYRLYNYANSLRQFFLIIKSNF